MSLLIFLFIISILITFLLWIVFSRLSTEIERKIGSRNYFLLSWLWWLSNDLKKK